MSTCEHCYEHTEGGPEWLIPVEDKRVCQACADLLREAAHEKLQQELEASLEYEKKINSLEGEVIRYRFALSYIEGYTRGRPLCSDDAIHFKELNKISSEALAGK